MTLQIADRVKETTTTTGTGALTLAGAMTGYRAFSSVCAVADTCHYALHAVDANGVPTGDWEVGIGTYSAANTLTRTAILASSNAGAAVNLAAGTKQIWIDYPAAAINSGPLAGMRNKIIGGDFSTNPFQRGINFSANNGTYLADRWKFFNSSAATFISGRQTNAPSVAQAGRLVTNSLLIVPTVADTTVGASDFALLEQSIEGYNFISLAQRPCVLSFWHAHTKTGVYCVAFRNSGNDRSFVAEYTQSAANVWEYTSVVVPPSPSAGTWDYVNGVGLEVSFIIMAGTTFQTTPGTWQAGSFLATANQVNGADSTANNFYIDLVQLEPGIIATPFEDLPVQTVLQLCQRYYEKSFAQGTDPASGIARGFRFISGRAGVAANYGSTRFQVTKRVAPTIITYNPNAAGSQVSDSSLALDCSATATNASDSMLLVNCNGNAATIVGNALDVNWTANAEF